MLISANLIEMILEQAAVDPGRVAVQYNGRSQSYAELVDSSLAVAARLKDRGIGLETVVGLWAERSLEYVSGLLGIMAAGAACLPLDPTYPTERLSKMVRETNAALLLSPTVPLKDAIADTAQVTIGELGKGTDTLQIDVVDLTDQLMAYVLYTSGSTGTPKGIVMEHGPLRKLIKWQRTQDDACDGPTLQFAQLSFDVAFQEILSTLCNGGTLVMATEADRRDPAALVDLMSRTSVCRAFFPTAYLPLLADAGRTASLSELRHIFVAGEALKTTPTLKAFMSGLPLCRLHNHYGPTETHVVASYQMPKDLDQWPELPPIGSAVPHAEFHIRNEAGRPVAPGDVGEIYISGGCVARGYVAQDVLTAERFIEDLSTGRRLYRTGDMGAEIDGLLHYRGRADRQVKIRGYRVEPDEIETKLAAHDSVVELAVNAERDVHAGAQLVAYVVSRTPPGELYRYKEHLRKDLPEYMVPTVWVERTALPRTPSGKIDRRRLEEERRAVRERPAPGRDAKGTQARVAAVWHHVLSSSSIGLDDNFFDVGGSSILFVHLQSELRRQLTVEVPITVLYDNPSIRLLSAWIAHHHSQPRGTGREGLAAVARAAETTEGFAVVGLACRFPGASSPAAFWRNLCHGVDSVTRAVADPDADEQFIAAAGTLRDVERFDAGFFKLSKRDAELLDPQHRIFLECAHEALEDAALQPQELGGRIGVFGGCGPSTYLMNNLVPTLGGPGPRNLISSIGDLQMLTSTDKDYLASQVSYRLDLRGPSINVNAACATALAAVHFACRSLASGECDAALAGAASISVPQLSGYNYEPGMVFSPDGFCRAFDENANGAVFGSGVGVVALKRLEDARKDGDEIYAVIRGSAFANDGGVKAGFTAPCEDGQVRVIRDALNAAGMQPDRIGFVEAHGTATPVGDAIELAALNQVFASSSPRKRAIGSVKTNVGHLGWAAGMAGLFKAVLALHHGKIPPSLNCAQPNPALNSKESGLFVNVGAPCDWPQSDLPHCAGVSAFGLGGASAHIVVEEAPTESPRTKQAPELVVLPLSAADPDTLAALGHAYADHLDANPHIDIHDVAKTTSLGRRHHPVRRALVAENRSDLVAQLRDVPAPPYHRKRLTDRVVGLFTGQGAERFGMGKDLYRAEPAFRDLMDRANDQLKSEQGFDMLAWLFETPTDDFAERIDLIQPSVFALEMALVELWRVRGVRLDATLGHSLGEFAAAASAGVFSFEDGLRLVAERGRLLKSLSDDAAMAAVFADEVTVRAAIASEGLHVWVAAVNSNVNTVMSGRKADVAHACAIFEQIRLEARQINVSRAGHSALMDPIRAAFEDAAAQIPMQPPQIEFISNVTGARADSLVTQPAYWGRHLCETVRFSDGLATISQSGVGAFVELGAAPHLIGIAQAALPDTQAIWLASMRPSEPECRTLAQGVAEMYAAGFDLDWQSIQGPAGRKIHLPTYPFQRSRYWIDAPRQECRQADRAPALPEARETRELSYQIKWQALPPNVPSAQLDHPAETWLVFADATGVAATLTDTARAAGHDVTLVSADDAFRAAPDGGYSIREGSAADLERLFAALSDKPLTRIVSFWALDAVLPEVAEVAPDVLGAARGPLELALTLAQQIASDRVSPPPMLALVTRGAQVVSHEDTELQPLQTAIWGLARTVALELSDAKIRCIDLDPQAKLCPERLAGALMAKLDGTEIALRADQILQPKLIKMPIKQRDVPPLRPDGSYLVTGGLGGIGLWTARKLAEIGARHLILAGRSAPTDAARKTIAAIEKTGATVTAVEVDISRPSDATGILVRALRDGFPVKGIVHCAGVINDRPVEQQSWQTIEPVLRPKVQGAFNLHAAASSLGQTLDFYLLQSSATSILGNFGQSGHGAACAFLDGLAAMRRLQGQAATSVNWGPWSDVGYLKSRPEIVEQLEQRGMGSLTGDEAADLLPSLLHTTQAQWAVLPNDWEAYLEYQDRADDPFFIDLCEDANRTADIETPIAQRLATADRKELRAELLTFLRDQAVQLLGTHAPRGQAQLDADCRLRDLGLDSLGAIQLRNILQSRLQIKLHPRIVYEKPTLNALADHLINDVFSDAWRDAQIVQVADVASALPPERQTEQIEGDGAGLSFQQQRWLRLIRDVDYGQRVVPIVFHAPLVPDAFRAALTQVLARHDVLRRVFPEDKAVALPAEELVPPSSDLFVDVSGLGAEARIEEVHKQVDLCRVGLGDPTDHPSWTLRCIKSSDAEFTVLLGLQHLAFDGTSLSVFVDELRDVYVAEMKGRAPALPAVIQYSSYAAQQKDYMQVAVTKERPYFEGLFTGVERTTALSEHQGFDKTTARPSQRFTPETPLADWAELNRAAEERDVTPFAILMASYATLVAELSSSHQAVIGVITSGRGDPRYTRTIGPFTSPFPVPITLGTDPVGLARQIDRLMTGIGARSAYPSVDLIEHVDAFKGFPLDTYFTDTCINFLNYRRQQQSSELKVEVLEILGPVARPEYADCGFDQLRRIPGLHLVAEVTEGMLRPNYWYHTERFAPDLVKGWAARHKDIMTHVLACFGRDA